MDEYLPNLIFGLIFLFIMIWKPLYKHFSGWGVLISYLSFSFSAIAAAIAIVEPWRHSAWFVSLFCLAVGVLWLVTSKRPPIERKPTVAWMVVNGLWDQLVKEGMPADEIERLKRLTPEERAGLMASLMAPTKARRHLNLEPDDDVDFYHGDADQYRL